MKSLTQKFQTPKSTAGSRVLERILMTTRAGLAVAAVSAIALLLFAAPRGTHAIRTSSVLTDDKRDPAELPITPAVGCTGANFSQPPGSPFAAGNSPQDVAVADFNLDGKADIVTVNGLSKNVSVLLGNGVGGFAPPINAPVGNGPELLAVGDFNLDGKPDVVVSNFDDTVTILLGNGAGGFTPSTLTGAGPTSFAVAVGDFNLDGKPDLAVSSFGTPNGLVRIFIGNGSGGFAQPAGPITVVGGAPRSIAIADLNLDGKPDLAVADAGANTITILTGNGTGGFTPAAGSPFPTGNNPQWISAADLNLDGRPDLAVVNATSGNVIVYLGNGAGGFTPTAPVTVGNFPVHSIVTDFNLDGKPDLLVANGSSNNVSLLLGDGTGSFTAASGSPVPAGSGPFSVAVGDFNGDGRPDFAVPDANATNVTVELNSCNATPCGAIGFTVASGSPFPAQDRIAATGDFNLDGKLDLAVVSTGGSNSMSILLGNGTGGFTQAAGSPMNIGLSSLSIVTADFNSDGKPDLAIARSGSAGVAIFIGNGNGGFSSVGTVGGVNTLFPQSLGVGDFNHDGHVDLIVALANGGSMLLLGDGASGFAVAPGSPFATPATVAVTVADFNQDGKLDAAFADYNSNKVTVLLGNGAGAFSEAAGSPIGVGKDPESITSGDFNHDGKPDLAVANLGDGNVTILLGNGAGGFTQAIGSPVAAVIDAFSIITGDFNLDGNPDLALVSTTAKSVSVLLGDGSGGFSQPSGSPIVGSHASATVASGDFNLDGRADLAVINGDIGGVTIYLNTCLGGAPTPTPTPTPTPIANLVQFNSANVSATEACTSIAITVTRSGDTSSPASVDYATADGSATERGDYITARGTLSFAPGDTSKTIPILINDDSFVEGSENFFVNLSNPNGFTLGTPATATITIADNASEPNPNVIDDAQSFVCQHYHDFLNRQPDQSGWDFWTNQITSCGSDANCLQIKRINVSQAFFLSTEFQKTGFLVERIYKAAFGDASGSSTVGGVHQIAVPVGRYNEFMADSQRIARGVIVGQAGADQLLEANTQAFTGEFVQRASFISAFPASMTAAQFVDKLNANAGGPLSQAERDQLVADLSNNIKTRAQVLRAVAEDPDLVNSEFNRAFVLAEYFGYLRRNPNDPQDTDYTGDDFWLTKLNHFGGNFTMAEMTKAFISSVEYRHRFGS